MIAADTSAFVAVLRNEVDARLLMVCAVRAGQVVVSAAAMVEMGIVLSSRFGQDGLPMLEGLMREIEARVVDVDRLQSLIAIEAFRRYGRGSGHPAKLNFGDCFSYALAKSRNLPLLFKGDDFVHTDVRSAMECA